MKRNIIDEKYKLEYESGLGKIFSVRLNLFCYIVISAFLIELAAGLTIFRKFLSAKDIPGIFGGIFFATLLLMTGRLARTPRLQKARAAVFSLLLISIAILAASAHPDVISYLGITLVLIAFFVSTLLLPWNAGQTALIGAFTIANFLFIYRMTGSYVNNEIFAINGILLAVSVFIGVLVKRSEWILRSKDFISRKGIEEKSAIMIKELELARKIQKSIIPHSIRGDIADIAVTYQPMFYMGGDYAKFNFIDKDKLLFVLADVTGHGVSSALLVNRIHTEIERLSREALLPGAILKALDRFINEDFGKMGFYISAFCGLLDFSKKQLVYSNHGHPPQILIQSKDKNIVLMNSQTFLMGIGMNEENVYNTNVDFERGDRLILFTDGVIEARDVSGELFGYERLERFADDNSSLDVVEFNKRLIADVNAFQAGDPTDDIFLLTIQTK